MTLIERLRRKFFPSPQERIDRRRIEECLGRPMSSLDDVAGTIGWIPFQPLARGLRIKPSRLWRMVVAAGLKTSVVVLRSENYDGAIVRMVRMVRYHEVRAICALVTGTSRKPAVDAMHAALGLNMMPRDFARFLVENWMPWCPRLWEMVTP